EGDVQHRRTLGEALADALLLGERVGHWGLRNRRPREGPWPGKPGTPRADLHPTGAQNGLVARPYEPLADSRAGGVLRPSKLGTPVTARPNPSPAVASEDKWKPGRGLPFGL